MWLLFIKQYHLFILIMPYCTFVHHFLNQKHIDYSYIDSIYWSCTIRTITVYIVGISKFVMHETSSPLSFSRVCLCSSSVCAFVKLISLQTSILTTDSYLSQDAFQPSQYSFTFLAYEHFTTFY